MTAAAIVIPVRPCIRCGACDRNKKGDCKPCAKIRVSAWLLANREKVKATYLAWVTKNPERKKATNCAFIDKNPERHKSNQSAWRKKNSDKIKIYGDKHRAANREKLREVSAAYYAANADRCNANAAKWREANPEAMRIIHQNRRERKRFNGGILSKGLVDKLLKLQKGKCACCKQPLGDDYHLDHVMPLALGGTNTDDNMQLLRKRCNLQKQAKHPVDFMQSRGFLL